MTNGELLDLARAFRAQLVQCNADKASIEADAFGAAARVPADDPSARPWWRFW